MLQRNTYFFPQQTYCRKWGLVEGLYSWHTQIKPVLQTFKILCYLLCSNKNFRNTHWISNCQLVDKGRFRGGKHSSSIILLIQLFLEGLHCWRNHCSLAAVVLFDQEIREFNDHERHCRNRIQANTYSPFIPQHFAMYHLYGRKKNPTALESHFRCK